MGSLASLLERLAGHRLPAFPPSSAVRPETEVRGYSRLRSRKNDVYLIHLSSIDIVAKIFRTNGLENELFHLSSCVGKGIRVPRPLGRVGRVLVMEYIPGNNACDILNETLGARIAILLADWFAGFHSAFGKGRITTVKSDAKLRNMIESRGVIYGVDFESAHRGDLIEDLGEVCSQILNTDPAFIDEKYELCDEFLRAYRSIHDVPLSGIGEATAASMVEAVRFRPQHRDALARASEQLRKGVWPFSAYR